MTKSEWGEIREKYEAILSETDELSALVNRYAEGDEEKAKIAKCLKTVSQIHEVRNLREKALCRN